MYMVTSGCNHCSYPVEIATFSEKHPSQFSWHAGPFFCLLSQICTKCFTAYTAWLLIQDGLHKVSTKSPVLYRFPVAITAFVGQVEFTAPQTFRPKLALWT